MNEMTLTPEKLDELERLAELATPEPWVKNHVRFGYSIWGGHPRYPAEEVVGTIDEEGRYGAIEKEADADFIAALDPATVRELVRLARIGERHETRPDPLGDAMNSGDGVYRP